MSVSSYNEPPKNMSDLVHKLFPSCVHTVCFKFLEDVLKKLHG